jgi:hypothetical protein
MHPPRSYVVGRPSPFRVSNHSSSAQRSIVGGLPMLER